VSVAMMRSDWRVWGCLTMSWMERTRWSEAMAQPGTMAREGVREAMGIRPRSARPERTSSAQSEGKV